MPASIHRVAGPRAHIWHYVSTAAAAAATTKQSWFTASGGAAAGQVWPGLNDSPLLTRKRVAKRRKNVNLFRLGGGSTGLVNNKTSASTDINVVSPYATHSIWRVPRRPFYDPGKWLSIGGRGGPGRRGLFRPQTNTQLTAAALLTTLKRITQMNGRKHRQAIIHYDST